MPAKKSPRSSYRSQRVSVERRQKEKVLETGYKPHPFQEQIHRNLKRFSVLACHRRFGKTVLAVNTLIDAAMRADPEVLPNPRYGYVAPFRNQAKEIAWDYVKLYTASLQKQGLVKWSETDLTCVFSHNNARLRLYGADNADAMRGGYFDGAVLDEVADMKPEVWGEIVRPMTADRQGWVLFIGTPKGINMFHDLYERSQKDPDWYGALFRADETNWLSEDELLDARGSMSEAQYRQEFLCDFGASVDSVLITIDEVVDSVKRVIRKEDIRMSAKVMGVDVARFGDDSSVILKRQGLLMYEPVVFKDIDNMALAEQVMIHAQEFEANTVIVDAGRGEGVIDRCRQLGLDVIDMNFGGTAMNPNRFGTRGAEAWKNMADWIRAGGCLPDNLRLKSDLTGRTYSFDGKDRMVLESKKNMKKRGLPSPDLGDAAAMTFSVPVMRNIDWSDNQAEDEVYDPLARLGSL